jgi:Flp pilus assembly protein TadG
MKRTHGQSLIEFALLIPIIILVLTVFIDLSRAIFFYASIDNAAREGTRYAIVNPLFTSADITAVESRAKSFASGMDPSQITVTVSRAIPAGLLDYYATVVVSYTFQPITPGLKLIIGAPGTITLSAQSSAMVSPKYNRAAP